MKKNLTSVLLIVAVVLTAGIHAQAEGLPLPPARISVIATGDFHGALEAKHSKIVDGREVGGIDIIAAYIEAIRRAHRGGVILLDSGDLYQGTLLSAASEGSSVIEFYNELGYDAAAVGNHDFDFGPVGYHSTPKSPEDDPLGVIKQRIAQAKFPFLAANIYDRATGKPVQWDNLKSYIIVKRKGVKVGIIGLITPDTPVVTHPANVSTLEFRPLLPTLRRVIPEVRKLGAQLIIVLAHAGVFHDEDSGEVSGPVAVLARALEPGEVDLIVAGHTHRAFSGRINGIPVIEPMPWGLSSVRADLVVDRNSKRVVQEQVTLHDNVLFFRTDRNGRPPKFAGRIIRPLKRFVKRLKAFKRSIAHLENIRLGQAMESLEHRTDLDSPVGNLVCDAIRASDKTIDIAMYNAGGIRSGIPKGVVTFCRIFQVVPFDNSLITVHLTGKQVRNILEKGLSASYGVMEISGLQVLFDPDAPAGRRCVSILTDKGEELDDNRLYKVATNEFVMNGGDGYYTFSRGTNVHNTHTLIRELVAQYIKEKGTLSPEAGGRYKPCKKSGEHKIP